MIRAVVRSVLEHSDKSDDKSIGDILKTFNEEQMNVLSFLLYKSFSMTDEQRKKLFSAQDSKG